jgi:hypothetical protein
MRTPAADTEIAKEMRTKSSTVRVQEKIKTLFLSQDNVSRVFDTITQVGTAHATTITVTAVTNPQNGVKNKDLPYTSIDVKVLIKGPLNASLDSLRALEALPTLSRILETGITEDKNNAQAPTIDATVRFFMTN